MASEDPIRLVCEVRTVGDSLTGRVTRDGGPSHEFAGWLGLLGLLQELILGTDAGPLPDAYPLPDASLTADAAPGPGTTGTDPS